MRRGPWRRELARGYARKEPDKAAQILRGIVAGVPIEYNGNRSINRTCRNLRSATEDGAEEKVSAIIAADVAAGKKAGPFDAQPFPAFSASPIGAVPKKNGKIRVIHHLSYPFGGDSINAETVDEYQELGRFDEAAKAIRALGPGCLLIKLDVEAAYKQVPVRREDWPLLGFMWQGKWYYERTLPFGLKSSCRLWELYATALHHFFVHTIGIEHVVHYIDDFLFVVAVGPSAQAQLTAALALCARLGVPMSNEKLEGPVTWLTFLGIELDTVLMTARLSAARLAELQLLLQSWVRKRVATVKELQSLTGILNFACTVVRPGRAFLRRIIDHTTAINGRTRRRAMQIPASVLRDIDWWIRFGGEFNGVGLLYENEWTHGEHIELFTDACNDGFGAIYGQRFIYGPWTRQQREEARRAKRMSMPFLELYALTLAVAAWGHEWKAKKIMLRSDCEGAVAAINSRSSRNEPMSALVRHLMILAARGQFDLRCKHIPGVLNVSADALSRQNLHDFRVDSPKAHQQPEATPQLPPISLM